MRSIWTRPLSQGAQIIIGLSGLFVFGISGLVEWAIGGPLPTLHLLFLALGFVGLWLEYYRRKQASARGLASKTDSAAG